ncbi:MAG: hypothetical protein ACTH8E_07250 [Brochothrix thermosphacta]|uniref:hypothetical protein n=1 Tax=Brochothrix thermosphacta TaxID=2756 RepID=UPI003F937648
MLNSLTFFCQRKLETDILYYHVLEHLIVRKLERALKKQHLDTEGILIDAETFVDGFYIQLIFSNNITGKLTSILNEVTHFTKKDTAILNIEKLIIASELNIDDLTSEDIALYSNLNKININLNLKSLYSDKKINEVNIFSLSKVYNDSPCKLISMIDSEINLIRDDPSITFQDDPYKINTNKNYFTGCIIKEITTINDYIYMNLLSFILGKNTESVIHEQYLKPFNNYLGYTQDLYLYNKYVLLYLIEKNNKVTPHIISSTKKIKRKSFDKFINGFRTYYLMELNNLSIPLLIIKLDLYTCRLTYDAWIQLILSHIEKITFENFMDFLEVTDA